MTDLLFEPIRLVRQEHPEGCGIATAAMIAGTSYQKAFEKIGVLPTESAGNYNAREKEFLNERGWWTTSQVLLQTVVSLDELKSIIRRDSNVAKAVETAQRCRLILAFSDGTKPDHSVIWG